MTIFYHYAMPIKECFQNFPISESGHYRYADNGNGYSLVAQTIAFGMDDGAIRRKNPVYDTVAEQRLVKIRETIKELCEKTQIEFTGMMPLDHGKNGVVVQINDGHVVRLQLGKLPERPISKHILQAMAYTYLGEENVTVELLEKVDVTSITSEDVQRKIQEAKEDGIIFWDSKPSNLGRHSDGTVYIIDPDSFSLKP